ncbi:MAG: hypothetical protein ABMA26_21740 [Limisphaerales bacterium]
MNFALLFASAIATTTALASAEDAPKPIRLIAEAEDFKVEKGPWQVVPYRENYYASTFAISFLSRMGCLGAPEQLEAGQSAIATQVIEVPRAGEFQVMARYEQPHNFSVEFTVEVVQGGKTVYRGDFGRLGDAKIWALNGHKRVPMERYWWGGTDNIVWQQSGTAKLAKGTATLRLIANAQMDGPTKRAMAARRNVDVICLTDDTVGIEAQRKSNYLEFDGWLVQDGDLFVRVTNPRDGLGPCVPLLAPYVQGQHSPYYIHVRDWPTTQVLKSGYLTGPTAYELTGPRSLAVKPKSLAARLDPEKFTAAPDPKKKNAPRTTQIPDEEYLQPGDVSGWVPMGHLLDSLNNSQWFPQANYKDAKIKDLHLKLEFAISDGKGGLKPIKTITLKGKPEGNSPVTFEMPGNAAPNAALAKALKERFWLPEIRTQKEALDWLNAEVAKFPKAGPVPKRFLAYNIMGFSGAAVLPEARQLARALGDNTAVDQTGKKRDLVAHWGDPSLPAIQKHEAARKGGFDDLYIVSYGDEIHLPSLPVTDEEFAAWLRARGVQYSGEVKVIAPKPKDTPEAVAAMKKHPLYYYSTICMKEKGGQHFAAGTAYYKSKGVLTGANYSPHANYFINEMDYIRPFKLRAMSMPWAEDYVWQIPEFSVQAMGYLTSGLRAGAKYDNLPIHMYVMPHSPGNTPRDFRLSFFTAVAHGTRMVNYFCATPSAVGYTENYVDTRDLPMWREVHACTHAAGTFEDYVMDGQVRPAKVGLILSSVDDVLTGANNSSFAMHNNERKAIYYALRHAQVPVDFLSEDDVIEGRAKDCQVIYILQQWMHSKATAALSKWVQAGGTLVALGGGGFMNEFNQSNPGANALYGVKSQSLATDPDLVPKYLLKENTPFLTKQDLPPYVPMDKVKWTRGDRTVTDVPVIVWKQTLVPSDAKVIGTFTDGKPAVLEKTHGKGRALLFGFLPGQAYLKSGLPLRPADRGATDAGYSHFLPTAMDPALRAALVDDFLPTGFTRPVVCSETLVESSAIDTPALAGNFARLGVPLMNYTGKPIAKLEVKLNGLTGAKSIRSIERGVLKPETRDGATFVTLPLNVADMLLIDR